MACSSMRSVRPFVGRVKMNARLGFETADTIAFFAWIFCRS